jgi:hypothetical protein
MSGDEICQGRYAVQVEPAGRDHSVDRIMAMGLRVSRDVQRPSNDNEPDNTGRGHGRGCG